MKKLHVVLALALLLCAVPLVFASTTAPAADAPAAPEVVAPVEQAPLILDREANMTALPGETPKAQLKQKNCEFQDTLVSTCSACANHCAMWLNCFVASCQPVSGSYWCDCTETAD